MLVKVRLTKGHNPPLSPPGAKMACLPRFQQLLMFPSRFVAGLALAITGLFAGQASVADDFADRSRSLFDGETLAGWEGHAYWFRIEDDAVVAGRLDDCRSYFGIGARLGTTGAVAGEVTVGPAGSKN